MNPRNPDEVGKDANDNKRKHENDDQVSEKVPFGAMKRRRESPSVLEGKGDAALSILQDATANEKLQALVTQSDVAEISKDDLKSITAASTPNPEVEGVTFPERLMELLMNETDKEALWWLPDGVSFGIHSKKFTKTILAKNFQGSKFESFTRKLARWGFRRLASPGIPHTFVFEHPYFLRDKPERAKEISGSKKKAPPPSPASADGSRSIIGSPRITESTRPVPAPAPWPTFGNQMHHSGDQNSNNTSASSGFYDDMIRQALLQRNLNAGPGGSGGEAIINNLLGRSVFSSFEQARSTEDRPSNLGSQQQQQQQQQDALLSAALAIEQDRTRALAAAVAAALNSSRPTGNASNHLLGQISAGLSISPFSQDTVDARLANLLLQQQRQQSAPPQDHLLRFLLQQQETNRQENVLAQQAQELLMQEILRREQQQRERDDRGRN